MQSSSTKSRSKARSAHPETRVKVFPMESRRVRATPGVWMLFIVALGMIAVGLGLTVGTRYMVDLATYATRLVEMGIQPGTVLVGGILLFGMALVAHYQRRHTVSLLAAGPVEEGLVEVGADLAELTNKLDELKGDHIQFQTAIESVRKEVQAHRANDRSNEAHDALFRLAGSLDTLHAQLDKSLTQASGSIQEAVGDVGALVEASRDFLQESLEEVEHQNAGLLEELRKAAEELQSLVEVGPGELLGSQSDLSGSSKGDEEGCWVSNEDDGAEADEDTGLGLLDELSDEEGFWEEEPDEGPDEEETGLGDPAETSAQEEKTTGKRSTETPEGDSSATPALAEPSGPLPVDRGDGPPPGGGPGSPSGAQSAPEAEASIQIQTIPVEPGIVPGTSVPPAPLQTPPPVPPQAGPPQAIPPQAGLPQAEPVPLPPLPAPIPPMAAPPADPAPAGDGGPTLIRLSDPPPPLPGDPPLPVQQPPAGPTAPQAGMDPEEDWESGTPFGSGGPPSPPPPAP